MPVNSVLSISGIDLPEFSVRGASQTLRPIQASAQVRRTVNGELLDISDESFRKYSSTIRCDDMSAPELDGIYPGQQVTVDCICELPYSGSPAKTAVSGSTYSDGGQAFYRPQLVMLVVDFEFETDEYGRRVSWTLDLEEV